MGGLKVEVSHERDSQLIADFDRMCASGKGPALFKRNPNVITEDIQVVDDPKGKTVLKVFDKRKFEKAVDTANLIVTVKGVVKAIVEAIGAIWSKIKNSAPSGFSDFQKTWGFVPDGIEVATAAYTLYDDGVHLVKAVRNGDQEEIKDRSLGVGVASMTVAGNSIGVAAYVEAGKTSASAVAQGAALGVAAGALGCVIWGVAAIVKAISIKRIWNRISKIKKIFQSSMENESAKIKRGIKEIKAQLELSQEEELKIHAKARGDVDVAKKERAKLLEAKVNKFKKRVGEESADKIKALIFNLSEDIESAHGHLDARLLGRSKHILKIYKRSLNKEISMNIMKFAGTVIGFVGAVVAFSNPIGAGVLAGIAAGVLIYSWYKNKYSSIDDYKKITIFGVKTNLLHYEIDPSESISSIQEEEQEELFAKKAMMETDAEYFQVGRDCEEESALVSRKRSKKLDNEKVIALDTYKIDAEDPDELPSSLQSRSVVRKKVHHSSPVDPHEVERERYRALMKRIQEQNALLFGQEVKVY